jgi:putative addiction module component (TIGR02574 family)
MLAEDLWDSVLGNVSEFDISENEKIILDQALEDLDNNPMGGVSWPEMKAKIKNKIHG